MQPDVPVPAGYPSVTARTRPPSTDSFTISLVDILAPVRSSDKDNNLIHDRFRRSSSYFKLALRRRESITFETSRLNRKNRTAGLLFGRFRSLQRLMTLPEVPGTQGIRFFNANFIRRSIEERLAGLSRWLAASAASAARKLSRWWLGVVRGNSLGGLGRQPGVKRVKETIYRGTQSGLTSLESVSALLSDLWRGCNARWTVLMNPQRRRASGHAKLPYFGLVVPSCKRLITAR